MTHAGHSSVNVTSALVIPISSLAKISYRNFVKCDLHFTLRKRKVGSKIYKYIDAQVVREWTTREHLYELNPNKTFELNIQYN